MNTHAVAVLLTLTMLLGTGVAWAAPGTQPATQPAATQPSRPMPPHGMGGGMAMPPGHPPMGMGRTGPTTMPSTQPFTGTLTIQAIQGTRNGPVPVGDEVSVDLFTRTGVRNIAAKLNDQGKLVLDKLQFEGPSQARVTVQHAGVPYEGVSGLLHADQADQTVEVAVYETTSTPVNWQVPMLHVRVQPAGGGLQAMEVLVIHNPSDRTYISEPGSDGQRTSISLNVPPNATQVAADGMFDECCVKAEPGKLTSRQPLRPGNSQVRVGYAVPAKDGKARLELKAPAPVGILAVLLPEDAPQVQVEGLQGPEPFQQGQIRAKMYRTGNLEAGQTVSLAFGAGQGGAGTGGGGIGGPVAGHEALIMIAGGALVLIILAALAALKRKRRAAAAAASGEQTSRDKVQW